MRREFVARRHIHSSPARAFDFVADYRNVPRVLEGVTRWDPLDERTEGAGARFDVEMSVLGLPLANVLVLDRWQPPERISWVSESGLIRQRGSWRFRPDGEEVEVELRIGYDPPGAVIGGLLAGQVDGLVRHRLQRALERMAELMEQQAWG